MLSKSYVARFLLTAGLLVLAGMCPDQARAAGFEQPAGIYINWAAYDEMSDTVMLDEALAMRQLEAMVRLRKLGVRLDYYVMDCNWFEPASGYRQWRKTSWPQGPDRWLKACRENGIKPGLWLSSNTLFAKMTPPPAWRASHDVPAKSFSMYEGGFLADFTNVMQFWVDQGVELFKFDFVNFWAATTNSSGLALEDRRHRNRAAFHEALLAFRQRNPQVRTLAYNGFVDIPLKPTMPEFRKWPVPRLFLDQLLDVFDGIYCGDPTFADVPTHNLWRSMDIYSDHQVRNWEFVGVPLDRIDSSAFMVGTTGTCYARRTAGWKAMLLLSLARGGWANTYYGDLNLISDEDARWFARVQSLYFPLQAKRGITSFGAVPGAVAPYGFLAREEGGALATVVNPSQRPATLTLPLSGRGRLLFADAGFTPQVQDGSVTLGPEQMAVIGFGTYAEARYELGRDTDSKIPVAIEPVQAKFVAAGSNSVSTTIPGVPEGKAVRILWQQFDSKGVPKRSLVFGNQLSAGKVLSIQAEQEGRPVPVQVDYDKPIWSGLSWAAGEIRSQDLAPGKPLKLTCTSLEPVAVEIRAQVYAVSSSRLRLEVVRTETEPVIGKGTPGAEKIPGGFEGGNSVKVMINGKPQYHFFSHAYPTLGWGRSQLDHWVSDDGQAFRHAGVMLPDYEDKAAGMKHIYTAPIPFYHEPEARWYLSYGEFVVKIGGTWTPDTGTMWCAPALTPGLAGIEGSYDFGRRYEFVKRQVLDKRPVSNSAPFRLKDGRWAVMVCPDGHVGPQSGHWPILLSFGESPLGPFVATPEPIVLPMLQPTGLTENPMPTKVKGPRTGREYWVAVFDFLGPEGGVYAPKNVFGFTWSLDGLHWPKENGQVVNIDEGLVPGEAGWWHTASAVRTPHQMLDEGGGLYTIFFTGMSKSGGFRAAGKVKVRLVED